MLDEDLRAPNLARLMAEGIRFDRAYAAYPLSAPAYASILTGRYPHQCGVTRNGAQLPPGTPTLSSELKAAGYRTGYIGNWLLDGEDLPGPVPPGPRRHGFDYWATPQSLGDRFEPDSRASLAIGFIREKRPPPFCLFVSWGALSAPHLPPQNSARPYPSETLHLRPNVPYADEHGARRDAADYYGSCSAIDANLGRLLACLDDLRLKENTVVVFTSCQGEMLRSHGLEGAGVAYEESARVPLVVRYPPVFEPGRTAGALLSSIDLAPSLLRLSGLGAPPGVQGADFRSEDREWIYAEGAMGSAREWRMLVRGLDKLVVNRQLEITHLFNLGQDPYEMRNLAHDPAQERLRDELQALFHEVMRRTQDRTDPSGLKKR